ncbi:hypothetical protein G9A89_006504 [Geosiphon pyriformis]|nr:hypothetical protein G9A89_006504 [Geosiphon pyriformis]
MSFEWSFGVVFELVVGANKLFGAAADKLLVAAVDKLEVNILVVDRLVAVLLAGKWFDIGLDLSSDSESEICDRDFYESVPISQEFCFELIEDFAGFEDSGSEIPKSGRGSSNQSPDDIDNCELNPSKYAPYGPNNSVFLCLLWNMNHSNANVMFDVAASICVGTGSLLMASIPPGFLFTVAINNFHSINNTSFLGYLI